MIELDIWFTQFGVRTQKLCKSQVSDSCCAKAVASPTPLPSTSFLATRPLGTPNVPLCTGYTRKYKRYVWKAFTMDRTATTRNKLNKIQRNQVWLICDDHPLHNESLLDGFGGNSRLACLTQDGQPSNSTRWTQATINRLQEEIRSIHEKVGAKRRKSQAGQPGRGRPAPLCSVSSLALAWKLSTTATTAYN